MHRLLCYDMTGEYIYLISLHMISGVVVCKAYVLNCLGGLSPFSLSLYTSNVVVCKASVLNWLGHPSPFSLYIYKQCSSMQGNMCSIARGGSYIYIYIYISLYIYISSVIECKAFWAWLTGGVYLPSISLYISRVAVCKAYVLNWLGRSIFLVSLPYI